jgi:hypothetical protein
MTAGDRKPACGRCGGTGFVYLWSIPRVGARLYFCDRPTCKRFWAAERTNGLSLRDEVVAHDIQPLVLTSDQSVLQPV